MTLRKRNNTKLEGYKKMLEARRETLASDLRQATSDFINDDVAYSDAIDQASADTDRSLALQMKNRDRTVLAQIDEALKRIDAGTFGSCQQCGDEIAEARIKAFPFTTLCIDCKSELEFEEHRQSRLAM